MISPVHAEARTRYLNPNSDVREHGESAGKYLSQEKCEGVFTIPGEHISNLHQNSWISLLAQVSNHNPKYIELGMMATSMPPLQIVFMSWVSFHHRCKVMRAGG